MRLVKAAYASSHGGMSTKTHLGLSHEKVGRRLHVKCQDGHPAIAKLAARGYHFDAELGVWWRQHSDAEVAFIHAITKEFNANTQPSAPADIDEALIVTGDTYPVRAELGRAGCDYANGIWTAPDRKTAEEARLYVATESMRRLGLPIPPKQDLYPPPSFIICGPLNDEEMERQLRENGATWIPDWNCWSASTKELGQRAQAFVRKSTGGKGNSKSPAAPEAENNTEAKDKASAPWREPALAENAARLVFHVPGIRQLDIKKGDPIQIEERKYEVLACGIEYGKTGKNRVWIHFRK